MTSWANQFDDLKNQFVARSRERLVAIEALMMKLQASPANTALLTQIMQHFHWLAGSGGTYGFDDITSWGTYGEELCDYLLKLGGPVTAGDHEKLMTALKTVEQLFGAQSSQTRMLLDETPVQSKMRNTMELLVPPGNTAQEAANQSSSNVSVPGAYTPPPQSQTPYGSSAGGYESAGYGSGSSTGPGGYGSGSSSGGYNNPQTNATSKTGGSLFSTASLSGAAAKPAANPGAGAAPYGQPDADPRASSLHGANSYDSQADTNPRGNALTSSSTRNPGLISGNNPPVREARTGAEPPGQFPAQGEQTRIISPMSAPPLSSGALNTNTTLMGQGQGRPAGPLDFAPGPAPKSEPRRSSRLAHIPIDKKFAIFADSNISNLAPVKAILEGRGILVEGVATASEAKTFFQERLPDVFIVGAPLIDNDGYELVEFLRGLDGGHKPIVIVLAQQAVFLDKVHAIRSGADAFFEYPSEINDLLEKINTLLDRDKTESYKILSVEDDLDMANFIKLTLQSAGYTVLHISDAKTFEEHFLSFEPDLVMLDVLLGDMTGFEIAKYIRQNDRFATLPIVFLTTQNKLHQHIRSAIAGGDEHLIKPVAPQLLIATVASRLERARSLKRLIDRDGLTRCLNFGSFMEKAQKLAQPDGYRSAPAMMMIDVDNMKKINEKMGFAAGDRIISNIANMLLKGFRNTDLIARFGNDQFAIVLEHLNPQQLQSLSSQVLGAISGTPQLVRGRSVSITCSGGVAILEQGMSVQEWLDAAQDSLRKAKDAGGNRAIVRPVRRQ